MSKAFDIKYIGKLLIILLAATFLLSACSKQAENGRALDSNEVSQAAAADPAEIDCWQGQILDTVYDVIGQTVMKQYDKLCAGSLSLMMMGFAVWLALRLLKFVSSVTESNPAELWNEIIKKAFICIFCASLAYSSSTLLYVINYFLFPIYGAFLEFGTQILSLAQTEVQSVEVFGSKIDFVINNVSCTVSGNSEATLNGFPSSFQETMSCMICVLADKMRLGRQMALTAMSMDGFLPWITGLLLYCIFYMVGFGFVFYLVDSIFRFGMMILMLPLFIMAYAFGPTKKWTGIGFSNIMHSAAFMMAFSIIIATVLMAIISLVADPETGGIFNPDDPEKHFQQISISTMCLILIGCLVWSSLQVSQALTSSIIGAHVDSKFQQDLKAFAQTVLKVVTAGGGWMLKKSGFYEKTKVGRAIKKVGAFHKKMNTLAGRKNDPNSIF